MPKYAGLRALLRPCMEGVDDPFSDAGEHVVYMRFYATAQSVLTDHLIGPKDRRFPSFHAHRGDPRVRLLRAVR